MIMVKLTLTFLSLFTSFGHKYHCLHFVQQQLHSVFRITEEPFARTLSLPLYSTYAAWSPRRAAITILPHVDMLAPTHGQGVAHN